MREGLIPRFEVKLLPCGLRATVAASDVVSAAENLRALAPANEAVVYRHDPPPVPPADWPAACARDPTLVTFGERPCAVHFVGFRGEEYHSAVRVFGVPDFYHRGHDKRAYREIADGDLVVFGPKGDPDRIGPYTYDDSNEVDDPAAQERKR
jgi:hypothetical protein